MTKAEAKKVLNRELMTMRRIEEENPNNYCASASWSMSEKLVEQARAVLDKPARPKRHPGECKK